MDEKSSTLPVEQVMDVKQLCQLRASRQAYVVPCLGYFQLLFSLTRSLSLAT
jgi:hypothetical protein